MRTLFDTEEEKLEGKASEITLSTASLLGIFFGLVLICGVFFGFGYSMGRGTGPGIHAKTPENQPGDADSVADAAPAHAPAPTSAPVATEQPEPPASASVAPTPAVKAAVKEEAPGEQASENNVPAKPVTPVLSKPAPGKEAPAYLPPVDAPPSAAGKPMVQIAAVARPEDAYVLVSALRQHGYGVVIRTEPQDKLLHVQVGPFADRGQAAAMKQKLLSDGYNAIIKQ
jgi:cell division septation protein DedD